MRLMGPDAFYSKVKPEEMREMKETKALRKGVRVPKLALRLDPANLLRLPHRLPLRQAQILMGMRVMKEMKATCRFCAI